MTDPGTLEGWRDWAASHARARGIQPLAALLDGLADATARLRAADWNDDAGRRADGDAETDVRP